jgi:hypothetical protein
MKKLLSCSIAAATLVLSTGANAQESSSLSFTTGVDYSKGDYGTGVDTEMVVAPISARLKVGDVRFTVSMPWLRIDGASAIVPGDGGPIIIDPNAPRTTRSGFGDVTVGANWALPEEKLGFGLDFGTRVKLPTASESKGLGTGKVDVSVSAELSKSFGPVTPFVSAGYRFPGDPAGFDLKNAFYGSAGASIIAGKAVIIGSYEYREATSPLAESSQEIFGALSAPVSDRLTFTLYGSGGLSDGAPDYGVGLMVTVKAF